MAMPTTIGTFTGVLLLFNYNQVTVACSGAQYETMDGSCYRFELHYKINWNNAQQRCEYDAADLVSLNTVAEKDFVINKIRSISTERWHLGLNDKAVVGQWVWMDGTPYTFSASDWESNEPDNIPVEDCVTMHFSYSTPRYADVGCNGPLARWVCEQPEGYCANPGESDNAVFNESGLSLYRYFKKDKTITYQCKNGYVLYDGHLQRECVDSLWTNHPPKCIAVCGDPSVGVINAALTRLPRGLLLAGTNVTFECVAPAVLIRGDLFRTCNDSGQWTGLPAVCQAPCSAPPDGLNVHHNGTNSSTYQHGTAVHYACDNDAYHVSDDSSDFCKYCDNGAWSGSVPFCEKTCDLRLNSGVSSHTVVENESMASLTLVTGCGRVTNTYALGNGTSVLSGMSVRNACNGTARPSSGDTYRTCHNGSWTGSPLNCSNCSPPENVNNTILHADWLDMHIQQEDYGGEIVPEVVTASYNCLEGYFLSSGDACRRCEGGYWTGNPPACHRACLPPEPGTNVVMNDNLQNFSTLLNGCNSAVRVDGRYPHETVLRYQCSQGRAHSAGTLNRTCENGQWSGQAPSCQVCNTYFLSGNFSGLNSIGTTRPLHQYYDRVVEPGISSSPRFRQRDRSKVYLMTVEGTWYIKNVEGVLDVSLKNSQNTSDPPIEPGWFYNIPDFGSAWVYDASVRLECIPGTCIHTYEYPGIPRVVSNWTTIEYSCLSGYHLFGGNTTNTCLDGEFTGTSPVCKECCSAPRNVTTSSLALVNAAVPAGMGCNTDTTMANGTLYPSGSMAIYTCFPGLVLHEGNSSRTCDNGTWSGAEAVCGVPRCSLLPLVKHANLTVFRPIHDDDNSAGFFINGTEAHYSCHTGYYRVSGNTYRKCENGNWTGKSPTCRDRCVVPPSGKNVEYDYDESPINGSVPINTSAYGICLPGHNLHSGQLCRKCEAALWSGAKPICARNCGALDPVPHANLSFVSPFGRFTCDSSPNQTPDNGEYLSGTQATYTCQDGYTYQNGSLNRTCYNGAWSGTPLECRAEPPPATTTDTGANTFTSDHTLVTTSLTDQTSAFTTTSTSTSALKTTPVSLNPTLPTQITSTDPRTQTGGRTTGTNTALTSDAQTTEHVTVTLPPNCLLSHLGGNEIVIQSVTHGNVANVVDVIYTCNTGFRFPDLSAQKTSKCFNGDWLNNVPCKVVSCPVLAVPQYASIDNSNVTYGSTVKITCQLGYWFDDGFNELSTTCTQNGNWNITNVPLCKIAVCPPPLEKVTSQLVTNNFTTYVYNMTVDYICVNDSFFVDGSTVRRSRCNAHGMWSLKYTPDCSKTITKVVPRKRGFRAIPMEAPMTVVIPNATFAVAVFTSIILFIVITDIPVFTVQIRRALRNIRQR